MAARKKPAKPQPKPAPKPAKKPEAKPAAKPLPVDPVKLAKARQLLHLDNDEAVLRRAVDFLLETYHPVSREEE